MEGPKQLAWASEEPPIDTLDYQEMRFRRSTFAIFLPWAT